MTGFAMTGKKSIAGYPKFHASDFEFSLPQPTYTINTLRTLEASYPDREFYFIMGADNWKYITRWVEYEAIIPIIRSSSIRAKDSNVEITGTISSHKRK